MIRAYALLVVLALGGCAGLGLGPLPPRAIVPTEPKLATDAFLSDDGARLPLRLWLPADGHVKATILALHGFDDYSNAFDGPATEWARHGIATYAYDQRGFGQAPDRGHWVGAKRLDEDVAVASRLVAATNPGVPHYILGESMGGAVAITAAAGTTGAARPVDDGLILVAPAVWGRQAMNIFERVALWTAYNTVPELELTGQGLGILPSDNLAMLRRLARDPLVIKETRVEAIHGLVDLMDLALASAPRLKQPLLLLYGRHDELIPPEPVTMFLATLPKATTAESRVAIYPDGYHMLLRDLEGPLVIHDVEAWTLDPVAPLPSGDDRRGAQVITARD